MANPTGTYSAIVNGAARTLSLNVDAQGNLVNSQMGSDSIFGSYDDSTGKLAFNEYFRWPAISLPHYTGYEMVLESGQGPALAFAGTFVELIVVRHDGGFYFQWVEHGWWATQILPE